MARGPLAGASGPGKFSSRTDLPSQYYGEGLETANLKSQQKLSKTRGVADDIGGRPSNPLTPITPLYARGKKYVSYYVPYVCLSVDARYFGGER